MFFKKAKEIEDLQENTRRLLSNSEHSRSLAVGYINEIHQLKLACRLSKELLDQRNAEIAKLKEEVKQSVSEKTQVRNRFSHYILELDNLKNKISRHKLEIFKE